MRRITTAARGNGVRAGLAGVLPEPTSLQRARDKQGFTLIEMSLVIAIIGVLAIIAVPNMGAMLPQYRLNRTVREFADHIQLARMSAIAQNRQYRICLVEKDAAPTTGNQTSNAGHYTIQAGNASTNSSSWDTLPIGTGSAAGDFVFNYSSGKYYTGVSLTGWTLLGGPGVGNENCIVFSPRGWIDNPTDDFSNAGYIQVYFRNKASNPRNDSRTVLVSRGGLTRIRSGDSSTVVTTP